MMMLQNMLTILSIIQVLLLGTTLADKQSLGPVTCGSSVKLVHKESGHHLHSHTIAWGSGSGQQSVTTTGSQGDVNSMWLLKEPFKGPLCDPGTPIKCGSTLRLEHVSTGKNLHSHLYRAPLSGNQEVSGFGERGEGDTGDNWKVVCESNDKIWQRGSPVYFVHADTGKMLYSADNLKFNQQNCGGGCPIMGQNEVSASGKKDVRNRFVTGQGLYLSPANENDEL